MENPDLRYFYNRPFVRLASVLYHRNPFIAFQLSMFSFFGNGHLVLGYPLVRAF
jgi:hypothetical protein